MKNIKIKILVVLFFSFSLNSCKELEPEKAEDIGFENIDVFILLTKTIHSFEINSKGDVLELEKNQDEQKFFRYNFSEKQVDTLTEKINEIVTKNKNKTQSHDDINSVDGTTYILRIRKGNKTLYEIESVFGDELSEVDKLIVFILEQKEINDKSILFENYLEYEKQVQSLNDLLESK